MADSGKLLQVALVGTGRMGRCLAALLKDHCRLTLCGRDLDKTSAIAATLGVNASGINECVGGADVLIAAIPTSALRSFTEQNCGEMRRGALFVDISSVKCGIIEEVSKILPDGIEYASIHPLFSSMKGRKKNIVLIQVRCSKMAPAFRGLLEKTGTRITETDAEEHDRVMAIVQVAQHFAFLAMRNSIAKLGCGHDLDHFSSYSFMRSMSVLKLIEGNLETVEFIQKSNKFAAQARALFIQESLSLDREYNKG